MKKFLAIALIAVSFTACNEGEKKTEETTTMETPAMESTTPAADTTAVMSVDTTHMMTDTTHK